jgi:hypothetical protein
MRNWFLGILILALPACGLFVGWAAVQDNQPANKIRLECPAGFRAEDSCRLNGDFTAGGWVVTVETIYP